MFTQNLLEILRVQYSGWMLDTSTHIPVVDYSGNTINIASGYTPGYGQGAAPNWFMPGHYESGSSGYQILHPSMARISNGSECFYGDKGDSTQPACGGIIIGDGNTAPAVTDYCLSGNMITTFSARAASPLVTIQGDRLVVTGAYTITNTGSTSFTIREIGLTESSSRDAAVANFVLLTHDVFANPVTIAPGSSDVISYQLKLY